MFIWFGGVPKHRHTHRGGFWFPLNDLEKISKRNSCNIVYKNMISNSICISVLLAGKYRFNIILNKAMFLQELISMGNWFHNFGATVWKARECELSDLTGMCSEDLLLLLSLTNVMISLRYDGPIPFTALNVNKHNLNSILSRTFSQCRSLSLSWTESFLLSPKIKRQARFWMLWSWLITALLHP